MLAKSEMTTVHINQGALCDALKRVRPAVSKEETRYYLCGVYMHWNEAEHGISFVATDGHRLSLVTVKTDDIHHNMPGVILSADSVAAIVKATGKRSHAYHDCPMLVSGSAVTVHPYQQPQIQCALVDGPFPNYMRVIPSGDPEHGIFTFKRDELLSAVAAVTAFREAAEDRPPAIRLSFNGTELTVSSLIGTVYGATENWTGNGARVSLKLAEPIAAPRDIGFDGRYLVDMLKTMESNQSVAFWFHDNEGPCAFKAASDGQWIVMPVRL